jgi:hypothetical protein
MEDSAEENLLVSVIKENNPLLVCISLLVKIFPKIQITKIFIVRCRIWLMDGLNSTQLIVTQDCVR